MAENTSKRLVFLFLIYAGVASAEQIALVPDTQAYTQNAAHHPLLLSQTSWIADNSETENLALISHVGDIVSFGGSVEPDDQWRFADPDYRQAKTSLLHLQKAHCPKHPFRARL